MRIAILLPMVWSVRNVVHAGVLHALAKAGVETHLIVWGPAGETTSGHGADTASSVRGTRSAADAAGGASGVRGRGADVGGNALFAEATNVHQLLDVIGRAPRGKAFVEAVLTSAFMRWHRVRSYDIYRRWFGRHHGWLARARGVVVEALGRLAASPRGVRVAERVAARFGRQPGDRALEPVRRQLRAIEPDLIWSTVNVSSREQPYRLVARELGVPVVTSILSFDNLTSRGPLPCDDHYLVWGVRMKTQLLRLYPQLEPRQATVTGTPQFDFHREPDCLWTRQRTLRALGLAWRRRYVLYGASHASLTPEEPELVAQLAARMAARPALADHALVLRLHPFDDLTRWAPALRLADRVRISPAFDTATIVDGWTLPTREDYARLTSSLAHADACVNIASTLSLDAAILDRPVIGIDFTSEPDSPRDMLYAEYEAEHYAPLVESHGLRLAHSWPELLDLLEDALTSPARDHDHRTQMVAAECGPVDGHAAHRVAQALIALAHKVPLVGETANAQLAHGRHNGALHVSASRPPATDAEDDGAEVAPTHDAQGVAQPEVAPTDGQRVGQTRVAQAQPAQQHIRGPHNGSLDVSASRPRGTDAEDADVAGGVR